jgi:hypothetical protein
MSPTMFPNAPDSEGFRGRGNAPKRVCAAPTMRSKNIQSKLDRNSPAGLFWTSLLEFSSFQRQEGGGGEERERVREREKKVETGNANCDRCGAGLLCAVLCAYLCVVQNSPGGAVFDRF